MLLFNEKLCVYPAVSLSLVPAQRAGSPMMIEYILNIQASVQNKVLVTVHGGDAFKWWS